MQVCVYRYRFNSGLGNPTLEILQAKGAVNASVERMTSSLHTFNHHALVKRF